MYTSFTEFTVSSMLAVPPPGRPRQMTMAEGPQTGGQQQQIQQQLRGWDNGIGGYQTNTMLETRIGATTNGGHEGN